MNSWDRQPLDDEQTWPWFQAYRDMPVPRRLDKLRVPGTVRPTLETLLGWYGGGCWRERVVAWDKHLDAMRQEEREELVRTEAREAAGREVALVRASGELAALELDKMLTTARASEAETLRPATALKAVEQAVKLGRLVRGESTEKVDTEHSISGIDDATLREWIRKRKLKSHADD